MSLNCIPPDPTIMKKFHPLVVATVAALSLASVEMQAAKDSIVTAVYSKTVNGYKRQLDADGSPKPEYYAIANGKYMQGALKDASIDDVKFPTIAGTVAKFLAKQNYHLANDMRSADLLLMISWGTTIPFNDGQYRNNLDHFSNAQNLVNSTTAAAANTGMSLEGIQSPESAIAQAAGDAFEHELIRMAMFEDMRMDANEQNARLLGYIEEINHRNNPSRFGGAGSAYDDLITDIENERYFVIIAAYDFQVALKEGKSKPLWVTRVSIQKYGNKFDKALATMISRASDHFGNQSGRLVRQYHQGEVTFGELKVISVVGEEEKSDDTSANKP
jgi:hypothetical protein